MNIFKKTILTVLASLFVIGNVNADKIKKEKRKINDLLMKKNSKNNQN